jgi:hypothetical protein
LPDRCQNWDKQRACQSDLVVCKPLINNIVGIRQMFYRSSPWPSSLRQSKNIGHSANETAIGALRSCARSNPGTLVERPAPVIHRQRLLGAGGILGGRPGPDHNGGDRDTKRV